MAAHEKLLNRVHYALASMERREIIPREKIRTNREGRIFDQGVNDGLMIARRILEQEIGTGRHVENKEE